MYSFIRICAVLSLRPRPANPTFLRHLMYEFSNIFRMKIIRYNIFGFMKLFLDTDWY